ncbi:hypothetical protein [Aquimarina algiphila]|uniref:hypothetical protein n=1 Tax=Aquimarina algiphila TaxID=2047982 RepID=UPI00249268E5|nr:hypothetical protein [Aquimarina algiphila]
MTTESLTLQYFNSWQDVVNFDETATCLHDHVKIDLGFFKTDNKIEFIEMMSNNPVPWKDVNLIFSKYTEDFACIIYEGINTQNNIKMRVSEALKIKDDKIIAIHSVISQLP